MSAPRPQIAVVTITHGRHRHLRHQQAGLRASTALPDHYVVVAMDDPDALTESATGPLAATRTALHLVDHPSSGLLPLAAARNAGAERALAAGADILVFLDVDCVPSPSTVARYAESVAAASVPALHCGVVRYLDEPDSRVDPPVLRGEPHPARPAPGPGVDLPSDRWQLFWSLSFAVSAATWRRLGGFHEAYVGYGAEDTDFGLAAHRAGVDLLWVGGADVFHQFHGSESPPISHLQDIVRNATIFHDRWGQWPMEGWLQRFAELGLARFEPATGRWLVTGAGPAPVG